MSALPTADLATLARAIDGGHNLARSCAVQAVKHARNVGQMLIFVKGQLPHGAFLPWLAEHCTVSPRQAQRYIAAFLGKDAKPRLKCDMASHLAEPEFEPVPGRIMLTMHDDGMYVIEPAAEAAGQFFVSVLRLVGEDDAELQHLTKPVDGLLVERVLSDFGMPAPEHSRWSLLKSHGVGAALRGAA